MRILMVAPQPFFSARGTPFSVLKRCRALSALGHEVDLVTYHLGEDVDVPGLRILRGPRLPGIKAVNIGPSTAKLPLDAVLFVRTAAQLLRRRYDAIHTHEEAGVFGWWLHRVAGIPHLYDMHSDLAQQLTNFGFGEGHPLTRFAGWLEYHILRSAKSVIVICPDLGDRVRAQAPDIDPVLIENMSFEAMPTAATVAGTREALAPRGSKLIVYAGSLEPYQGIPLLIDAMAALRLTSAGDEAHLIVAGGRPDQVAEASQRASVAGISDQVTFLGLRSPGEVNAIVSAADVLVSPRVSGTNTPLKIYSWLRLGRPIVATRIATHTQVLDDSIAVLVEPTPKALGGGIAEVLSDPALADRVGAAARQRAAERYNSRVYLERTIEALRRLNVESNGQQRSLADALRSFEAA
jgi:glycosyltransferase involved in cell wall biosynthesis